MDNSQVVGDVGRTGGPRHRAHPRLKRRAAAPLYAACRLGPRAWSVPAPQAPIHDSRRPTTSSGTSNIGKWLDAPSRSTLNQG